MKFRNKYYPTKLLEKYKYDKLMALDKNIVKLYFVADPKGNYLYWLNDMNMPELETKSIRKTTLWNGEKKDKEIYMLTENKASIVNKNEPSRTGKSIWDEYYKKNK